jgi:hypothetical protein
MEKCVFFFHAGAYKSTYTPLNQKIGKEPLFGYVSPAILLLIAHSSLLFEG